MMNRRVFVLVVVAFICVAYVSSVKINGLSKGNTLSRQRSQRRSTSSQSKNSRSQSSQKRAARRSSIQEKIGANKAKEHLKSGGKAKSFHQCMREVRRDKVRKNWNLREQKAYCKHIDRTSTDSKNEGSQPKKTGGKKIRMVVDADFNSDDVIAFLYLLKKRDDVDLVGVTVNGNCWVHLQPAMDAAYHLAHLLGRDDVPIGLGEAYALREEKRVPAAKQTLEHGNFEADQNGAPWGGARHGCLYQQSVPEGPPGRVYTDAMYGVARSLPKSPRWFRPPVYKMPSGDKRTKEEENNKYDLFEENDPIYNLPRQKFAHEVLHEAAEGGEFVLLTLGTLTNIHKWLGKYKDDAKKISKLVVMGGVIDRNVGNGPNQVPQGNVWSVPKIKKNEVHRNPDTEFNLYLDPHAAKFVLENKDIKRVEIVGLEATNPLYAKTFHATKEDKAKGHPSHTAPYPEYVDKIGSTTAEDAHHKLTTEAQVVKNLLTMVERTWDPYEKDAKGKWINGGFVKEYRLWDPFAAIVAIDDSYVDYQATPVEVYVQDTVHLGNTGARDEVSGQKLHARVADGVLKYKPNGRVMHVAFPKGACGSHNVEHNHKCDKQADINIQKKAFEELISALRSIKHSSKLSLYMPGH